MSASSSIYEGGCPFKNFDINILKNLFLCFSLSNNHITKILYDYLIISSLYLLKILKLLVPNSLKY